MAAPKVDLSTSGSKTDGIVLGWFQGESSKKAEPAPPQYLGERSQDLDELTLRLRHSKHFFGNAKETSVLRYYAYGAHGNTCLLGLGARDKWTTEAAREAGGAVYLAQKAGRLPKLSVQGDSVFPAEGGGSVDGYLQAFAEGYLMCDYGFEELKAPSPTDFHPKGIEIVGLNNAASKKAVARGTALAEAVNLARLLGDRPGNFMTPTDMGKMAQKIARETTGLTCKVMGRSVLEKEKMGLFLGVARGSVEEPKLVEFKYNGGKKSDKPIVFVGKGITFDSGGISIKPAQKMEDMKYDMMGAAAVFGIMKAVANLKLPLNIVGYVGAAENMPDGNAQKPGDVARSLSGKTVEIINTDAEGRLVMADVIEYAQKYNKPQCIVDFATLTGAVLVALGTVTTGIMGNSGELLVRMKEASKRSGERVWELPLYDEYDEDLKSPFADYRNSGNRDAGSSKAGTFLKFFVEKGMPWVHCDIAGTAWARKDAGYLSPKWGTGVMVRTIIELLDPWKPLAAKK